MSGFASVLGFGPVCDVRVTLDGEADRLKTKRRGATAVSAASAAPSSLADTGENGGGSGASSTTTTGGAGLCIYSKGEGVSGTVYVTPRVGKVVEHLGITVQLLGQVELFFDKGNYYDIFRRTCARMCVCLQCLRASERVRARPCVCVCVCDMLRVYAHMWRSCNATLLSLQYMQSYCCA